jgi:glycine/D-amino acid oxidase-like deaminating enzyme
MGYASRMNQALPNESQQDPSSYKRRSWWLESLPADIVPEAPLADEQRTDIAVIGGGFTGLSTAYHLRQLVPDAQVRVLESEVCGFGASGRNGGFSMTLFGLTKGITALRFGHQKAREAHSYMEEAVDYLDRTIREKKFACDYERSGYLLIGTSKAQCKRIEEDFRIAERWGLSGIEAWDRDRLRQEFQTESYLSGWFESRCGIVNPAKLAREWKRIAMESGAIVHENSPVSALSRDKTGGFLIECAGGRLRADRVVFATNAYSSLIPQLASKQVPVFTHIVLSEPLSPERLASIGWRNRAGVEDARNLIHYYRLTADNRIVMGGGDVSVTFGRNFERDQNEQIFAHLRQHVVDVFPQLAGLRFTHGWGGPVSVTLDMAPALGFLGKDRRAVYSLGTVGHGVSMTAYNGLTIAELLAGRTSSRTGQFFVGRRTIPWPPEPLRFGAIQAIRGVLRAEDRLRFG